MYQYVPLNYFYYVSIYTFKKMILYSLIILLLGFIGLFFGGKYVIVGLENISNRFGISHLLVGLTVLSIGTSLPEIAISVMGGVDKLFGYSEIIDGIVIGNKIGSFLVQITLILGLLGLSQHIFVSKWILRREGPMLFISVIVFLIVAFDGVITQFDAVILIVVYILYLILIIKSEKKIERIKNENGILEKEELEQVDFEPVKHTKKPTSFKRDIITFLGGLLILLIAAELTVLSAVDIATEFNVPGNVIGILIVGIGTSIPELSVDLTALRRKSHGIAVGDILGSNICDILLATGSGAIITSFNVPSILLFFDIPMLFVAISIAYFSLLTEKILKHWESILLVSYFGFYTFLKLAFFQI